MYKLIIFLGDQGSQKDQLFKLLPIEFKEIVFEKLLIKERIDQDHTKLIVINFPEENEITQAITSLLTLSQYFKITQIVFCLHYVQSIIQKVQHIQKKFNEAVNQQVEEIYTFFISNSPQTNRNEMSRLYSFCKIDESIKQKFIRILEDIYKNTCYSYISQTKLQSSILQQQESLKQRVSILNKQFQEEYLSNYLDQQLETKLQNILSNDMQPLSQSTVEILDRTIKQNEIVSYSDAIYQLCWKKEEQIQQLNKFLGLFDKFWYCRNCKILYQKQGNNSIIYELSLFSLDEREIDNEQTSKCFRCSKYLTQHKKIIIPFLQQIYILKQIKSNLKINGQSQVENKKQLIQEKIQTLKSKKDCISILLLSNEEELKQFVMQQVYDIKNYKEKNQFKEGYILNDSFYLIDTPIFQFDEDSDELESNYSNYLNNNPIHFIIFCLKLQRSSLMKERLLNMLKKLPNINKQAFCVFIMNQNCDFSVEKSSESEITDCIKGIIPQTTLIQNNTTSLHIINKISDFIKKVDKLQPISFEQTIFHKQDNQQNQEQIEKSLQLISQGIQGKFIQNCQQEIMNEEARQQNLDLQKQQLKQEISNLNSEFYEKKKELTNLIYSIQQELYEQERIHKDNINNLNNQIYQTEKEQRNSNLNIQYQKRQLNQMEYENKKKSYIVNNNYARKTKYY